MREDSDAGSNFDDTDFNAGSLSEEKLGDVREFFERTPEGSALVQE